MASEDRAAASPASTPQINAATSASLTSQATASPGVWGSIKQALFGATRAESSDEEETDLVPGDGDQADTQAGVASQCLALVADQSSTLAGLLTECWQLQSPDRGPWISRAKSLYFNRYVLVQLAQAGHDGVPDQRLKVRAVQDVDQGALSTPAATSEPLPRCGTCDSAYLLTFCPQCQSEQHASHCNLY